MGIVRGHLVNRNRVSTIAVTSLIILNREHSLVNL
jgi:hypothetical protein